jgi:hypothetical protein
MHDSPARSEHAPDDARREKPEVTRRHAWLAALILAWGAGEAPAQDPHPALTPPAGFQVTVPGAEDRTFELKVPNGDRLRIRVLLQPAGGEPDAIAKGPAVEEGDQVREETRQAVKSGTLSGVTYSVSGRTETVEGVSYTRYRRVIGMQIEGNAVPFAARADILAREPKPAQSTLESMARAFTEWQERMGGVSKTPPATGENAGSRPAIGGEQVVRLAGGGDLEITVPAFWGRVDLRHGEGHEEIILGPARDVLQAVTTDTLAKDKDRIGPYISITRIQKDAFKDAIDVQILDIKDGLLADYVARQADAGIVLSLSSNRDEGTLGTRTVISVPFEEKRASGTTHRGRSVFMMHRGSLVIVTASHPTEKFDEGWPDIAQAFDTLLFTGAVEPEGPASRATAPEPGPGTEPQPKDPSQPAPGPEREPAPSQPETGGRKLAPAPAGWVREGEGGMKAVEIPTPTPISFSMPAGWSLIGDPDATQPLQAFVASAKPEAPIDPFQSALHVDYFGFQEQLAGSAGLPRLAALMRLRLAQDARTLGATANVVSAQDVGFAGRTGHAIQYQIRGDRVASGTVLGTVIDGTAIVADLRVGSDDATTILPISSQILGSIKIDVKDELTLKTFGPYTVLVPTGWELSDTENPAGGRNIFMRAPSGVDVRFQTAPQKKYEVIDVEMLRRVSAGFLVDGLKVLTQKEMIGARRVLVPGGGPGLRFESATAQMNVLVLASMQREHLIFALRGAPPAYGGRDLAVAWAAMQSFTALGVDRATRADPVRTAGAAVSRRVAFYRTELDGIAPDGTYRPESSLFIALLPDGSAGFVPCVNGKSEDLRGTYRIEGDVVTLEVSGRKMTYRLGDDTLRGEVPGDVLFRARDEETP